jgi:Domain of unknown function (DUF222)/HNH endonuclease
VIDEIRNDAISVVSAPAAARPPAYRAGSGGPVGADIEDEADALHPEVDVMAPGGVVSVWLSGVDLDTLSGPDRVRALRGHSRMVAYHQAMMFQAITSIADEIDATWEEPDPELTMDAAVAELRAALHLTRRAAEFELGFAFASRHRMPAVLQALRSGSIDLRRARVLVDETIHLSDEHARRIVDEALLRAEHLTTGELRAWLRRLCIEHDPEEAKARYRQATDRRCVSAEPTETGTAHLIGSDLPPDRVAAVMNRLTSIATGLRTAEEARTLDQLRADVFLDLLEGTGSYPAGKGTVDIRVDLTTLAALDNKAVELAGFGPVVADIARQTIERQKRSRWTFTVVDPATGDVVHAGTTRRRPNSAQRRLVGAGETTCVFPGCRMPAAQCDLDHRIPWSEGGTTTVDQLVPLCRHDHVVRHRAGWAHNLDPTGDHQWTSPIGTVYTTTRAP